MRAEPPLLINHIECVELLIPFSLILKCEDGDTLIDTARYLVWVGPNGSSVGKQGMPDGGANMVSGTSGNSVI